MDKESIFIQRLITPVSKKDRLVSFFKNQQFVDCTFKLDGSEVKAHKLILACSSPVFERMLYGDMAQDTIEICDINVQEFNQVLEHIYTENIDIYSMLNAWNLFYIANKYLLDELIHECLTYIRNNLTMSSVVLSYEYAEMYDLLDIKQKCFDDMVNYINGVFYCDYHIKPSTVIAILDKVSSLSFDLLVKIIKWGVIECENRQKQVLPSNVVELLREEKILKYFKRDCLDFGNFQQVDEHLVKDTLVLLSDLLEWSKEPFDLSVPPIITPKYCRMRKEFKIALRIDLLQNEEFASGFSVDRKMIIFGISINTPMEPPCISKKLFYEGAISVRICQCDTQKDVVEPMKFNKLIPYNFSDIYLNFYNLAVLEPNVLYNFRISFNNPNFKGTTPLHCYYMSNKLLSENKDSAITFYEINGTIIKGVSFYPD
ncbi:unnamed protein product [Psylliodes chrysocephalus]|uniref:BTB domain-containing protein n=1 Tax=Psylliodes chrysocephalus TaxID=3402493 RepID=A0A9P0GCI4_9CUCU|nr:unnamed protein product [Psylliodes chrysocephala]